MQCRVLWSRIAKARCLPVALLALSGTGSLPDARLHTGLFSALTKSQTSSTRDSLLHVCHATLLSAAVHRYHICRIFVSSSHRLDQEFLRSRAVSYAFPLVDGQGPAEI